MIVIVDDLRTHPSADVHLRTSAEALDFLMAFSGRIDELWLDHDLGGDDTVRPVVLWLAERSFGGDPVEIGRVGVQSMNPVGAEWICGTLGRYYTVYRGAF